MQQNLAQARIVDPVLSEYARGYKNSALVAENLFPRAPVPMYGGTIIEFGKESFRLYNSKRAPGAATKRVQFGYDGKPYAIVPSALEAPVPRERMRDASVVPGIDLARRAVNVVLQSLLLEHEFNAATLARDATQYDASHKVALSGTSIWGQAAAKPGDDIESARQAIRSSIGVYPNLCILSASAMSNLRNDVTILDRIKYTSRDSVTTDILQNLWQIPKVVVGAAVSASGAADTFGDIWGSDVVLAYTNLSNDPNAEEPSFAYTYLIDGMPMVEQPYWEENTKSWIYGVSYDNAPVLSGISAGFLIQGAGG